MSRKTLNAANLERLGAQKLAHLVMDLVQGSAALQRRARMELSAAQGPKDVAADLRKRLASLRRSTAYLDWRKQKALVKDLAGLLAMVESAVAPHDPDEAFELLWALLQVAGSIYERTDDSNGAVGEMMREAVDMIELLSEKIACAPDTLAERILDAVADAGYGEFDGIVPATTAALGDAGLEHLKTITTQWAASPLSERELDRYRAFGFSASPEDSARRNRELTASIILADVADAQGDVDAYMARYSAEQLTFGTIAPGVARRLLDAGRVDEAHDIIEGARTAERATRGWMFRHDLDEVYEDCLERQGKTEALRAHLLATFEEALSVRCLRRYLKLLPDFEDIEAEEKALSHVQAQDDIHAALEFLIEWPAHERASKLVLSRADELDGNAYYTLSPAADAIEGDFPLAATILRRALVQHTLDHGKSKRYRHAARHVAECASSDAGIDSYGVFPSHERFLERLRQKHGRKQGFWQLVGE